MEALVILLAEFLSGPIIALVALLAELVLFLFSFLLDLALWLFFRKRSAAAGVRDGGERQEPDRRSNVPRRMRTIALAGFALSLGGLLLVNFVFFEPTARWVLAQVAKRTHTELDFKAVSGNIFSGTIIFEDLHARRSSETRSSFDLTARRLHADIDPWTLVFRPILFQSLAVETVSGTLRQPEKRKPAGGKTVSSEDDEKIKARRTFHVQDLTLKDVNIMLSKGDNAPVAVSLTSVSSAPFRSNYALFDTLFRSNLTGKIDGRDISVSTQQSDGGRLTQWRMPDLQAATVSRFVTRPPIGWLRDGTLNVSVDDRWRLGIGADIDMDWNVRMQDVRAEAREEAGLMEKTFALPVTGYINSKNGNVDLRFKLVINENKFENMSSLDASFFWDVFLQSMTKAIGIDTSDKPEAIRQGVDKAIKGFKGFIDKRRKQSDTN
jgi:hypothetical protein